MKTAGLVLFGLMLACALIIGVGGCGSDSDDDDASDPSPADDDDDDAQSDDDDAADPACDPSFRPIVFIHGFLEDGDAFETQTLRFATNGYCIDRIFSFDYNTLDDTEPESLRLVEFVDDVLAQTAAPQVDMIGHSMGGSMVYDYLAIEAQAANVAHSACVGAYDWPDLPFGVSAINIGSPADTMMGVSEIPGATNVVLEDLDHLQIATSAPVFEQLYRFFNETEPVTTEIEPTHLIELSGRAVVFGVNDAAPGWTVEVWEIDPPTGMRIGDSPEATLVTDSRGYWEGFTARADAYYEFVLNDPALFWAPIHYYRRPFVRSDNKVYFRVFPNPWTALGLVFRFLPLNDNNAIFAWLNINQAVVLGRDTFTVNGFDLAIEGIADPAATAIAVFFFDTNFNGQSENGPAPWGIYSSFPFIRFVDMLIPADPEGPISFTFNDDAYAIRNWKSKSEGISIAVFE